MGDLDSLMPKDGQMKEKQELGQDAAIPAKQRTQRTRKVREDAQDVQSRNLTLTPVSTRALQGL